MLDVGINIAFPSVRTVCHVEGEAHAAAVLASRMEEGSLAPAPIWSDVRTFDARPWRGVVDCVVGGYPCTDISLAGKGDGLAGAKSGLFWELVRIVRDVRPRLLFLENVAAHLVRDFDTVLGALASLGYDAEWMCLRASDVGAPHRRDRVFILAHSRDDRRSERSEAYHLDRCNEPGNNAHRRNQDVAHRRGQRLEGFAPGRAALRAAGRSSRAEGSVGQESLPDTYGRPERIEPERHKCRTAERRDAEPFDVGPWPPRPNNSEAWAGVLRRSPALAPALSQEEVESLVCGVADGDAAWVDPSLRAHRLRATGNAVVPIQAAVAFTVLARRAGLTGEAEHLGRK